jgi:hypothetical protein
VNGRAVDGSIPASTAKPHSDSPTSSGLAPTVWCHKHVFGPPPLDHPSFRGAYHPTPKIQVCGNLKDVFVILIGFSSFNDAVFDPINAAGIALGVLGSVAYAVVKLR